MVKKFFILGLLFHSIIFSFENSSAKHVDFGKFPTIEKGYYKSLDQDLWELGCYAFNYAPELTSFFALLKSEHSIKVVVETGTFHGGTTIAFAHLFDSVHTIENNQSFFDGSKQRLEKMDNVVCHFGSSEQVLEKILPDLKNERALFYLDAHWGNFWPLLDELEKISNTHKDNCIIVIDDFKVPGRKDIPYDYYGPNECSLEYVQNHLDEIFSSYSVQFLIPKSTGSRAKLVVIPTSWKVKQ